MILKKQDPYAALREAAASLRRRVQANEETVAEEWTQLDRIEKLANIEADERTRRRRAQAIRIVFGGALGVGVLILVLSYIPFWRDTQIDAIVRCGFVRLTFESVRPLTAAPVLLQRVKLWSKRSTGSQKVEDAMMSGSSGMISLNGLDAPRGSSVALESFPDRYHARFSAQSGEVLVGIDLSGSLEVNRQAAQALDEHEDYRGVTLDMDMYLAPHALLPFAVQFPVQGAEFYESREGLKISRVNSGTLYMESLAGKKFDLRAGELMELDNFNGSILGLTAAPDGFRLRAYGTAHRIWLGAGDDRRDQTPSILDWIRANHAVDLFWTASAALVALLVSALQILGVLDK